MTVRSYPLEGFLTRPSMIVLKWAEFKLSTAISPRSNFTFQGSACLRARRSRYMSYKVRQRVSAICAFYRQCRDRSFPGHRIKVLSLTVCNERNTRCNIGWNTVTAGLGHEWLRHYQVTDTWSSWVGSFGELRTCPTGRMSLHVTLRSRLYSHTRLRTVFGQRENSGDAQDGRLGR